MVEETKDMIVDKKRLIRRKSSRKMELEPSPRSPARKSNSSRDIRYGMDRELYLKVWCIVITYSSVKLDMMLLEKRRVWIG